MNTTEQLVRLRRIAQAIADSMEDVADRLDAEERRLLATDIRLVALRFTWQLSEFLSRYERNEREP